MRNRFHLLAFSVAVVAALVALEADSDAQQPGKKGPFGKKGFGPNAPVTADQLVDRLLSFDKNNDGKITQDELPERMQHLLALGDVNKDGAFDKGEVEKLATTLEAFTGLTGGGPIPVKGQKGGKGDGFKGAKKDGKKGAFKGPVAEVQRTLDDLNVTGATRDRADRVLQLQQDKLRRFEELTRTELILEMKDVLTADDYRILKSAFEQPFDPPFAKKGPPGKGFPPKKGPPGKGFNPPDTLTRIDQIQKDLEDLRHKLKK